MIELPKSRQRAITAYSSVERLQNKPPTLKTINDNTSNSARSRQFVLDCNQLIKLKLPVYNPLLDRNLNTYFDSSRMKKQLLKMKLVGKNNEAVQQNVVITHNGMRRSITEFSIQGITYRDKTTRKRVLADRLPWKEEFDCLTHARPSALKFSLHPLSKTQIIRGNCKTSIPRAFRVRSIHTRIL